MKKFLDWFFSFRWSPKKGVTHMKGVLLIGLVLLCVILWQIWKAYKDNILALFS